VYAIVSILQGRHTVLAGFAAESCWSTSLVRDILARGGPNLVIRLLIISLWSRRGGGYQRNVDDINIANLGHSVLGTADTARESDIRGVLYHRS
jgi:hypothetical protein